MTVADMSGGAKAVIVISSHVMRGSVGNRAAVFALETLGHAVWAVPTVILPWHPGHGPSTRIVPPPEQFEAALADLAKSPWLGEVGAVVSGYLGDASQATAIAALVASVRKANPGALYVCDPVIGDQDGLYVPQATAKAIRDCLFPIANVATPNRFELEWLTGGPLPDNTAIVEAARAAPPARMAVTSAYPMLKNGTGNLLISGARVILAEHRALANPPNGLGDLTSALLAAHLVSGIGEEKALRAATASVFEVLALTVKTGADELQLQANASSLTRPMAQVEMRILQTSSARHVINQIQRPVAGVDGCKKGWISVFRMHPLAVPKTAVFKTFGDLLANLPSETLITVDMPIGLLEHNGPVGRGPETAVRKYLKSRKVSVFSIPSRSAVYSEPSSIRTAAEIVEAHRRACEVARQTSSPSKAFPIQTFAILSKIREIDSQLRADKTLRTRVIESHPEVAFWRLNNEEEVSSKKKDKHGKEERRALLAKHGFDGDFLRQPPPRGAADDDFLDACAMMLIAERHAQGLTQPFPDPPLTDSHGIQIAIWV